MKYKNYEAQESLRNYALTDLHTCQTTRSSMITAM